MKKSELVSEIYEELEDVRSDVGEINIMASGGIDSGVLMALGMPDRVFTVRLPYGPRHDEYEDLLKSVRHLGLEDRLVTIELDEDLFDEYTREAVKAIGRPIPHFNIFPLFTMFKKMKEMGIKHVVCGDGPDETMCGYTRHLIMQYMYSAYSIEAFIHYRGMITKLLGDLTIEEQYAMLIGKDPADVEKIFQATFLTKEDANLLDCMCAVDMELMRPDMDDMSNNIAKHFGIKIHRPYQDGLIDEMMFYLPAEQKVQGEFGKYLLREIAAEYLPFEIAWRKQKIGGPVVPVNKIMGWSLEPFDKSAWIKYQEDILSE
jgi:asparagine synthase (glutamine-hydrolysing)